MFAAFDSSFTLRRVKEPPFVTQSNPNGGFWWGPLSGLLTQRDFLSEDEKK
jgi:hypothetical protein